MRGVGESEPRTLGCSGDLAKQRQVSTLQSGLGRVPRSFRAGSVLKGRRVALGALAMDIS